MDDDPTGKMDERLLVLSVEGMRLVGRRLLHNPAAHKALITVDLAEGQPTLLQLDSMFYSNLLVSALLYKSVSFCLYCLSMAVCKAIVAVNLAGKQATPLQLNWIFHLNLSVSSLPTRANSLVNRIYCQRWFASR